MTRRQRCQLLVVLAVVDWSTCRTLVLSPADARGWVGYVTDMVALAILAAALAGVARDAHRRGRRRS